MHHTAIGDGDSAGYEVILRIPFVICHDKQAEGGWGVGKMGHECQKEEGGVRRKNTSKEK